MKLIKQTKLHFREGNSDKVYEADICEVAPNEYVVNFRYGKRGASLTEGTKTVSPVDMKKAQELFDKLIKEKTAKGYQDVSAGGEALAPPAATFERSGDPQTDRTRAVLWHLEMGVSNPVKQRQKRWNIKRAIWRAGELRLAEAAPLLPKLFGKGLVKEKDLYDYCILWAMGRIAATHGGDPAVFQACMDDANIGAMGKRMAWSGLVLATPLTERPALAAKIKSQLPDVVQNVLENPAQLSTLLQGYANEKRRSGTSLACLPDLYLLSTILPNPALKKVIVDLLRMIPLAPNFFRQVRYVFKLAHQREDTQILGTLGARFESTKAFYSQNARGYASIPGEYKSVKAATEVAKPDSRLAYSSKTRKHFTGVVVEKLEGLGAAASVEYVKMATAFLLCFDSNQSNSSLYEQKRWEWNQKTRAYITHSTWFPPFADCDIFNNILNKNNPYGLKYDPAKGKWAYPEGVNPHEKGHPKTRTEAYPELWDKMPLAYVQLLLEAKAPVVADFALNRLKEHADYEQLIARFDLTVILKLIKHPSENIAKFAVHLLKKRNESLSLPILTALLDSPLKDLVNFALSYLKENAIAFFPNTEFIQKLYLHPNETVRNWLAQNWESVLGMWKVEQRQLFVGRMIAHFLQQNSPAQAQLDFVKKHFLRQLVGMSLEVISDLLYHPSALVKNFAAEILFVHEVPAGRLPLDLVKYLIFSLQPNLSKMGMNIFYKFEESEMFANRTLILEGFVSALDEPRKRMLSVITKFIRNEEEARFWIDKMLPYMLKKEAWEGVHAHISQFILKDLQAYLHLVHRDLIFRLLNADSIPAQQIACVLVDRYVPAASLSLRNIVRLADHEILAARQIAWRMYNEQLARVKAEPAEALRLLDAKWDDSRGFAITYFRKNFTDADWTPELLVGICDSVREDIQALGTELITKYFQTENGEAYLLKLSQHPRPRVQFFATNYLNSYATGKLEIIQKLEFYFISVLSQVNKIRIAKDRVFQFLGRESLKSEQAATFVAGMLNRISATCAIGDKAQCIELLRNIHKQYPSVETAITLIAETV